MIQIKIINQESISLQIKIQLYIMKENNRTLNVKNKEKKEESKQDVRISLLIIEVGCQVLQLEFCI